MDYLSERDLEQHVTILGWLFIFGHALFLLLGVFVFLLLTTIGAVSGDQQALVILSIVGTGVGILLTVLAVPGIVAGIGLLRRQSWARILAIVVGMLSLINFPLGTAIGIYTLWVLLQRSATDYFASTPA
jgi:hypothetical protein